MDRLWMFSTAYSLGLRSPDLGTGDSVERRSGIFVEVCLLRCLDHFDRISDTSTHQLQEADSTRSSHYTLLRGMGF